MQVGSLPCHHRLVLSFLTITRPHSDLPAGWPVPLGRGTRGDWHEEIYAGVLRASRVGMNKT